MEEFVLKIVGIICVTLFAIIIVVARKDDIDIWSVLIASIFEIFAIFIIYMPTDGIIQLIEKIREIV